MLFCSHFILCALFSRSLSPLLSSVSEAHRRPRHAHAARLRVLVELRPAHGGETSSRLFFIIIVTFEKETEI